RLMLDTVRIQEIVLILNDFWREGSIGRSVIVILKKEADASAREKNRIRVCCCREPRDLAERCKTRFEYPQGYFETLPHNRFRLLFSRDDMDFTRRIEEGSIPLSDIVSIHTGVRSRIGQKSIVAGEKRGETWRAGLISGREIGRYRLDYGGNFLNTDPSILWSGGHDASIVSREKLLVRQTGDSIHATYDGDGYYHLNNCHSIVLRDAAYSLKFVLAILNSRLMNHYYHLISLERGRALAQIDMDMLGEIPVRPIPRDAQEKFVRHVDRLLTLNAQKDTGKSAGEAEEVLIRLDGLVNTLYGFDPDWTPGEGDSSFR
ncbi:MAG TPA: TaqI-like C-terminal specificity domain-containing protein, partial [Methanomicrobiales archaeon]|nr:TaqI-like C-terminal specificity domain-containing protein [Methanomicrobiales archaeon]